MQNLSAAGGGRCSATSPSIRLQRSVLYFDRCFRTRFGLTPMAARATVVADRDNLTQLAPGICVTI
jgi:hypothetical protein